MSLNIGRMKKLITDESMFFGMYLFATLLGIVAVFILISVYNKTDFFFLHSDDMKFYGLFITGFVMCSLAMNSAINYSGWNNIFVIISGLIGIALVVTLLLFLFNVRLLFIDSKSDLIYLLGSLLFLKIGVATIQRIAVLAS